MPEIKTPVLVYVKPNGEEFVVITEEHTLADIARWILKNRSEAEEMIYLLQEGLNDSNTKGKDNVQ